VKKVPTLLNVHAQADGKSVLLGQVGYDAKRATGSFEWSEQALAAGLEWSPINLPLSDKLWVSGPSDRDLLGLPGLIHDALPDGWGLLLMNRAFNQHGIAPSDITPLLRLAFLADRCWGALRFDPEWGSDLTKKQRASLSLMATEAQHVQSGDTATVSNRLLTAGGSPHGARPKIMVAINDEESHVLVGHETLPDGYRHVLIKFAGDGEPATHPLLEYCYTQAARNMGIVTMPAKMLRSDGPMGVCFDRFDRQAGQRQHVHSMAGMLHTTHRISNSDWTHVADLLRALPGGSADLHEAFKRAVFNCVFSARDDHTKNISFLRNPDGRWGLTPAYDICYSPGPGGWHTMTYAQNSDKYVTREDLIRLSASFGVEPSQVSSLVEQSQDARSQMLIAAQNEGVAKATLRELAAQFRAIDQALGVAPNPRPRPK
jgi:serine/threonine-protein kinase HipA